MIKLPVLGRTIQKERCYAFYARTEAADFVHDCVL